MQGRSPYMNLQEVAAYCRLLDRDGGLRVDAARKWVYRAGLEIRRCGRQMLVHRDAVELALTGKRAR